MSSAKPADRAAKPQRKLAQVEGWLSSRHDAAIEDLSPLGGGFWSSAYGYRAGGSEFVLRVCDTRDGFDIDAAAMSFASPALPVPEVVEIASGLGGYCAISLRHRGRFIEAAPADEAQAVGAALGALLAALRSVPAAPGESVLWFDAEASADLTWPAVVESGLVDDPSARVGGWRKTLAKDPRLDAVFEACASRVRELLPCCPDRRDLVHGDLLHQNVLVAEDDPSVVTAIFSWKCSVRGDFLFDVAWCTLFGAWHPAIADANVWRRTLEAPDLGPRDLVDAPLRHHCYELQIAASHLGWYAWTGDEGELATLARIAERLLERGPLER